jgi:L-threonylcarbamoyladenylate synthase
MGSSSEKSLQLTAATSQLLRSGGIAVMPTDTIYGVVGQALNQKTVERIYVLKKRTPTKPVIILIGDIDEVKKFGVALSDVERAICERLWPGAVSIILPCAQANFEYLHRGTQTLAFRLPANEVLRIFLRETGPLIAPSANTEGESPAQNIAEARNYFHNDVDVYEDGGQLVGEPSTLISIAGGRVIILRQGAVSIPKDLLGAS